MESNLLWGMSTLIAAQIGVYWFLIKVWGEVSGLKVMKEFWTEKAEELNGGLFNAELPICTAASSLKQHDCPTRDHQD